MTVIEKALKVKNDKEQFEKFCKTMFDKGRDWLDLETLFQAIGYDDKEGKIYKIYEEWQWEE